VVERAVDAGLAAIALTDHDTLAGVPEAVGAAALRRLECLTGVEISAVFDRQEVHILGYGVSLTCDALNEALARLQEARHTRADRIIERLQARGLTIEPENVARQAGEAAPGRLHIARELRDMGVVKKEQEAFDRYIGRGRCAYVSKELLPAEEAIRVIHEAGGLAFVAHPGIGDLHRKKRALFTLPFDGIEAFHSDHTAGEAEVFLQMANERGWLVCGGSDDHGAAKGRSGDMGKVHVAYRYYERLKERLADRNAGA
jgi:hypothetical protein